MNSFKKIVVLGDRMTGKTQFVNSNKMEDAFVIDEIDFTLINEHMDEYLSDKHSQSILVLQYPYNIPQLTDNIDCIVLFRINENIRDAVQTMFNLPEDLMETVTKLNKYDYIVYKCKFDK